MSPAATQEFTFREEDHTYWLDGQRLPSVTEILNEWILVNIYGSEYYINTVNGTTVDKETFEAAGDFGRAVHKAAQYILMGGLDWTALNPALVPCVKQFAKWVEDYNVRPVMVETALFSKSMGVAGTPDIFCHIKGTTQLVQPDLKTGMSAMVGPQTAIYSELYRLHAKYKGFIKRYELKLPKDGSAYKFTALTNRKDLQLFKSKHFEWKWRQANGK